MYISNENNKNSMHLGDGSISTEEQFHIAKFLKSNQYFELKFKNVWNSLILVKNAR